LSTLEHGLGALADLGRDFVRHLKIELGTVAQFGGQLGHDFLALGDLFSTWLSPPFHGAVQARPRSRPPFTDLDPLRLRATLEAQQRRWF
jgi:hypothetical protein